MPLARPTVEQVQDRIETEIRSRLGVGPLLRRSILGAIGRALAGAVWSLFGYLDWISRQMLPDTADGAQLQRWATIEEISRKLSVAATGPVTFYGGEGAAVPIGTQVRSAAGDLYRTTVAAIVSGGSIAVHVEALVGGTSGNLATDVDLTLTSGVAGVQSDANVATPGLLGGEDEETDEELRARLLQRLGNRPHGGAPNDYVAWALEVPGVTRAWCFANYNGVGTVGLTFAVDDDPAGPIPTPAQVQTVQDYVLLGRRPVGARLQVFAPTPYRVNVQVHLTPNTAPVQADVDAALRDLFAREGVPGGTLPLSHLDEAISTSQGEVDHALVSPVGDVIPPRGYLPVLGTLTFS